MKSYCKLNLVLLVSKRKKVLHKIKGIFYLYKNIYDELKISFNTSKNNITYFFKKTKYWTKMEIKDCILAKTINILKTFGLIAQNVFFNIIVFKKIPIGSGLGGASSNAATFLLFLKKNNCLKKASKRQWKKIYLQIGSDVSFFVSQFQYAIVKNYGEKVKKMKCKRKLNIKLFLNDIVCNTREVYHIFDYLSEKKFNFMLQLCYFWFGYYAKLVNNLTKACFVLYPQIGQKFYSLKQKYNDNVFLSGSGSSFFIINKISYAKKRK